MSNARYTRRPENVRKHQAKLPPLPVPPLRETASRYLESLLPVLTPEEYQRSAAAVADFIRPGGQGEILQRLLEAYATTKVNWLESWWRDMVYLEGRDPLPLNSNCHLTVRDDPQQATAQIDRRTGRYNIPGSTFTPFQLRRAAHIIHETVNYCEVVQTGAIPLPVTRQGPQCAEQFFSLFGTVRIPQRIRDRLRQENPLKLHHVLVMAKGQAYRVPVLADTGPNGPRVRLTVGDLEDHLWQVVKDAQHPSVASAPSVALLTAGDRDNWADARTHLLQLDPRNAQYFEAVETSIFGLNLDDYHFATDLNASTSNAAIGRGGRNRWFDVCITAIVDSSGRMGWNGEHAPCDATVMALLVDYVLATPIRWPHVCPRSDPENVTVPPVERLAFVTDRTVEEAIDRAAAQGQAIADRSTIHVQSFTEYGETFIKRVAQMPPNSFIHMAVQLAYYRLHGRCVPTYEAVGTCSFKHGRTETNRVLTQESLAFVRAMGDSDKISEAVAYDRLRRATKAHARNGARASTGGGIDRHLFGLQMAYHHLLKPLSPDQPKPELHPVFSDPGMTKSAHWVLSTANLFPSSTFASTGFGAVVRPDGYGVSYTRAAHSFRFNVETTMGSSTNPAALCNAIRHALLDLGKLCQEQACGVPSKL
ncbi:hypothetical protein IWQ60_003234 [Tieghemiomyces parasiticus]|uniref:Choline/carnitine acyltransferase domain-containing protein n=1 Tax=Tieghemiomyces parasiticus TaxID=78921 RepID=A0A9W8AAQ1_9FUNG|nr:hypothetical protein IWQ60_003234 [Tieghemiomyces parasiticus]